MKNITYSIRYTIVIIGLIYSINSFSQSDTNVQHIQDDVARNGASTSGFTPVSSVNNAFSLANNNRKSNAGRSDLNASNLAGRDVSGARRLTGTNTLSYYRDNNSLNTDMRFSSSIWEYTGLPGGDNEFIVRGRYVVTLNGGTNNVTTGLTGITNANKCIPFITGILNNSAGPDADSGTAIAYLENATTLRVQKGSNANNVSVYITVVEFTGNNWNVLHGDASSANDTGSISLKMNSDASGATTSVNNWDNAVIFTHHRGDMADNGANEGLDDNWPLTTPGSLSTVDWEFDGGHSGNARQFVHVLENASINVTRYQDTSNSDGETTINIASAGLTSINQALIVGNSITNGGGTAYGRGWRNYYLKSTAEAAHWSHRSGNNMNHEIQIVDLIGLTTINCATTINTFPYTESFETGSGDWEQGTNTVDDNIDWLRDQNGTPSGGTGPSGASDGSWYLFTESSGSNNNKLAILESPCFDLSGISFPEFSFAYHMYGVNMGDLSVDISIDNGANYVNIWSQSGQVQTSNNAAWEYATLFLGAYSGETVKLRFRGFTGNGYRSDMAIDDILLENIIPVPEISVLGKDDREILNGDLIPDYIDGTNFGIINLGSSLERTFTVDNSNGTSDLDITNITLSNTTDFAITGTPYNTPIAAGSSTTFSITYTATTTGTQTSTVRIYNNDSDESVYTFEIQGSAVQYFYDSDGDGILDNLDIDDDNDGIPDTTEESNCGAVGGTIVNYKFLNETFGVGTGRSTINTNNYAATTTYCFEDGIVGPNSPDCPFQSSWILDDGEYCVVSKITGTAANDPENIHGDLAWYNGEDHTPGDTNGRMAVFNASFSPGVFYETTITGVLSNLPVTYSFWALNIMAQNTFPGSILPDISVQFLDLDGNLLSTYNTNPFGRCTASTTSNTCSQGEWHQFSTSVNLGNTNSFIVRFINNAPGGGGNDLAIDDIVIAQTLCDTDGDGVADVFDLDSDNDGIPDVVEAGLGDISDGTATLTNIAGWSDTNMNGMHDFVEGFSILNSDADTVPNYIDLDSDNDTIFDVDESKVGNTANVNFDNGDGDINGDGVGDGLDTDNVRQQDIDSDGLTEFFPDGILDIYDYYNGTTFNTAYGNQNQGLGSTYYVLDSDNDGIPDYMDITSNGSTYDISQTLYASLDTNNNGRIGGLNYNSDNDKDGILDLFDTDDNRFGSPRDLERKLDLYFDGRNDYIEDSELLSGKTNATIMGWIKIDPTFITGESVIIGQNNLEIALKAVSSNYSVSAVANETNATNNLTSHPLIANRWYHVAAAFDGNNGEITLFINGERVTTTGGAGSSLSVNSDKFTIGKEANINDKYFKGVIDEVRIFNKTLSDNEIQKMVYQEIENNSGNVRGSVIPKDITDFVSPSTINPLDWPSLLRYYRMDVYKDDIVDDLTTPGFDIGTGAKLYNAKLINYQTAPMPFVTQSSGNLPDTVDIPADGVNGDDAVTYDWSIVQVRHNDVSFNDHQGHLGLFIDELDASSTPIEYKVNNDSELNVSWYLELNGFIDLEGESQLVQGYESDLIVGTNGRIEKDQQGTQDLYTYNYWSSPVGATATGSVNNYKYTLNNNILKDGTDTDLPVNISFVGGYDGSNSGSTIEIAHYWIWKFNNRLSDDYASWQHVRNTGDIFAGEGFTMKGVANTNGNVSLEQNYVFDGKPNNGDVSLEIFAGNDYLVGNPYASAIDAEQFITDNGPTIAGNGANPLISGTLYFWEHWGGGSHVLADYQGGYGTYNYSGGLPAAAWGVPDPDVAQVGTGTKTPGRYIPVGQGFFVTGESDGFINFNNGQRVFQKEGTAASVFMRNSENRENSTVELDERIKIRLGFNSVNTIHRQLLVTADDRASIDYDWGFDAELNEEQMDDMFWIINDVNYIIQGIDTFSESTILPLGIKTRDDGLNNITIDLLENVPNSLEIYAHDKELNIYHDLRASNYDVFLEAGEYLDRFEITFTNQSLSVDEFDIGEDLQVFYVNSNGSIVIQNPKLIDLKSAEMFNIIGQSITRFDNIETKSYLELKTNKLSTGTYILNLKTTDGAEITKKVLVK